MSKSRFLGSCDGEVEAEELRAFAEIDDAAVLLEVAADVGDPAIAEIDVAGRSTDSVEGAGEADLSSALAGLRRGASLARESGCASASPARAWPAAAGCCGKGRHSVKRTASRNLI